MAKKLLIGIDIQKDFVEGGMLPYGYPEESNTKKVVDYILECAKKKDESICVLLTRDTHDSDFKTTLEGQLLFKHCIKGTEGWEFADYTDKDGSKIEWFCDEVILKKTFGTFRIAEWIKDFEETECETIDEIQIVGYDMAVCVLSNAVILRSAFPNKKIVVLKDYCGCIDKETFDAAVTVLKCQQIEVI